MINTTGSHPVQYETQTEINPAGGLCHASFLFWVSDAYGVRAVCRAGLISPLHLARQRVTLRNVLGLCCGQPVSKATSKLNGVETAPIKNGFMVIYNDPGLTPLANITGELFRIVFGLLRNEFNHYRSPKGLSDSYCLMIRG